MELSNLPEEKVLEICREMDDITLANFMRTSRGNRRICGEVLVKRDKEYNLIINDILRVVLEIGQIYLETPFRDRELNLMRSRGYDTMYDLEEMIYTRIFLLQKIAKRIYPAMYSIKYRTEEEISNLLLELFHQGYITGEFKTKSDRYDKFII